MMEHRRMILGRRGASRWFAVGAISAAVAGGSLVYAANKEIKADLSKLPPPATKKVDYAKDIQPILKKSCADCHSGNGASAGFSVDKVAQIIKGGDSGPAVIPGKSEKSPLVLYVAGLVKDMEMPPSGAGDPLTKEQVGLLRAWIDQMPKKEDDKPAEQK